MDVGTRAVVLIVAAAVFGTAFQRIPTDASQTVPRFEQFSIAGTAIFRGIPADPRFETPGQRMYRTMIRLATKKGPNFAGHYTVAEWGCGTACEQIAVVDSQTGNVFDGP